MLPPIFLNIRNKRVEGKYYGYYTGLRGMILLFYFGKTLWEIPAETFGQIVLGKLTLLKGQVPKDKIHIALGKVRRGDLRLPWED